MNITIENFTNDLQLTLLNSIARLLLLCCAKLQNTLWAHTNSMTVEQQRRPLRLAIYNQVNYHLHVVAGAMRVLQPLTSAPITVFLTSKVLNENWYGFMDWLGKEEGFEWKDCADYDSTGAYE